MKEDPLSIDELGEFLLSSPPRMVSEKITQIAKKRCASQIGSPGCVIMILLFCLPLFYFAFPLNLTSEIKLQTGATATTRSTSLRAHSANLRINNRQVYRYLFRFKTPAGNEVKGVCYGDGQNPSRQVLYLQTDPEIARLVGARMDLFGAWGLLVLLFPSGGFLLVYFGWRSRQKVTVLLACGLFAPGKITEMKSHSSVQGGAANQPRIYRVTVTFTVAGKEMESFFTAQGENALVVLRKYKSGETVGILYDPSKPKSMIVADMLVG